LINEEEDEEEGQIDSDDLLLNSFVYENNNSGKVNEHDDHERPLSTRFFREDGGFSGESSESAERSYSFDTPNLLVQVGNKEVKHVA